MVKTVKRFSVYLVSLNPTIGSEINKTRPCVVISPNEMNKYIDTVIIAPMTVAIRTYPTRPQLTFCDKEGQIVLDQIRTVDKKRLIKCIGELPENIAHEVSNVLVEMFQY